ncbi:hypothetical protein [Streptomyces longwoodensis]
MPLLTAAILLVAGCQGEDKQSGSQAPARTEGPSCAHVFSTQGKEAVKRMADIPASSSATFLGRPQEAAERLVAQYDAGTPDKSRAVDFCDVHKEAAGLDSAQVSFSLAEDVPERGRSASIFKEYRMAKAALVGTKVGVLYFACASKQLAAGKGGTVLVRGEVRSRYETSAPDSTARQDALRVIYESSFSFSKLLGCKSNADLPETFTMPPELAK